MTKFSEDIPLHGQFSITIRRNGIIVEQYEEKNLIVNAARQSVARLIAGDVAGKSIASIAFGTSGTSASADDTSIANPYIKAISSVSYPELTKAQFNWELLITEANGLAIMEFGLLTQDGTLFARRTRSSPINKGVDIAMSGQWTIIF
jgi:hypothetical protein